LYPGKSGEVRVAHKKVEYKTGNYGSRASLAESRSSGPRCALCGIRVRTLNGHTAVTAAHIVPWSESQDDRPANGTALCRMCHWTFDEGLLGVSQVYEVIASRQLNTLDNLPGYLTNLEGRSIVGPARKPLWPDTESLRWHRENVLRTR
jgi:putative restriction endonuclease